MDASRDFKPLIDIKPEPTYHSKEKDSTDNMSVRSRSSSAAQASSHGSAHMSKQDYEQLEKFKRAQLASVPPLFAPHPPPTTSGMDASRDFKPLIDIKPEPTYQSKDSTDNMSVRSRSSSAAPASSHGSAHMGPQDYEDLQTIVTTPLGQVPSTVAGFPSPFASVLSGPATVARTVVPSTSTTSVPPPFAFAPHSPPTTSGMDALGDFEPLIDIKPEPTYQSKNSTDNMSERSRSSSAAPASSHGSAHMGPQDYEMSSEEQERRKLERKLAGNRAAARKCRQKKLDCIKELESMLNTEKQRSMSLMEENERIRSQLHHLEQIAALHAAHGCPSHV